VVLLGPEHLHTGQDQNSPARCEALAILEYRGSAPMTYKNTHVFLAADSGRTKNLEQATRQYLASKSAWEERELLDAVTDSPACLTWQT